MYYLIALCRFDTKNRWAYCERSIDHGKLYVAAKKRTNDNFIYKVIKENELEVYKVNGIE